MLIIGLPKKRQPRDSQRKRVYAAEREAGFEKTLPLPSIADMEKYAKKVWESKRLRKLYPHMLMNLVPPRIEDGRGKQHARGGAFAVWMPRWSRYAGILLHELAHSLHERKKDWKRDEPWHGWRFCAIYLDMARIFMGREYADKLKAAFKKHKVKFRAPRTGTNRTVSPQALAALQAYREQKREQKLAATPTTSSKPPVNIGAAFVLPPGFFGGFGGVGA